MNKIQQVQNQTVRKELPQQVDSSVCFVPRTTVPPNLAAEWEQDSVWSALKGVNIGHFHRRSGINRPATEVRLTHNGSTLFVSFRVTGDRRVRRVHTRYQSMVSEDSSVEFFAQPAAEGAYLNFEVNCIGTLLLYHIEDPRRGVRDRLFRAYEPVPEKLGKTVKIVSSLSKNDKTELSGPLAWRVSLAIPITLIRNYFPTVNQLGKTKWRGNFFKCMSRNPGAHWAAWRPIGNVLRFHQPKYFGTLEFE